jgi:hypothetical protein
MGAVDTHSLLALALDPSGLLRAQGIEPDSWQQKVLLSPARQLLLNCCRQAGMGKPVSDLVSSSAAAESRSETAFL